MKRLAFSLALLLALSATATAQTRRGWLDGTWVGTAYQTNDNTTWTMRLDARRGKFTAEYPSLDCGGEWRLVRLTRWRATLTEIITRNPDRCEPRGNVRLLRLGSGQILYLYSYKDSPKIIASAVLNRQ